MRPLRIHLLSSCLLRTPPRPYVVLLKGIAAAEADLERGVARASLRALARAEGWNARRADGVVVPSDYSAGEAKLRYGVHPDRIIVLPEGIDGDAWARLRNQPPATRAGLPTVLTVARQYRRKNTETLLRALPALARRVPDVRLRVVGGGPRLPHLQRLAAELAVAERVTFTGPVPDETVRREYFRAWCFCLPSLQEAFGIASLEAMAAGLPVVAARTAATPEVVPEGVAGLLVDPYDTDALAAALVRILLDRELRRRFAEAGVRRAAALDMAAQARELIDTLAPLLPTPELVERAA